MAQRPERTKRKFNLPFSENVNNSDLINIKKDQTTDGYWIRYGRLKEDILADVVVPEQGVSATFMIDYSDSVVLDAAWFDGSYAGKISTDALVINHTLPQRWHLSRLDANGRNLDLPLNSDSLWDVIIDGSSGASVFFKVYNREDESQYIYLKSHGDTFGKSNEAGGYYDLEFTATTIISNNIVSGTIQNPSVAIVIARQTDVVRNNTDTYTSYPKQKNVVTLSQSEWAALGAGRDPNTLFVTPYNTQTDELVINDTIIKMLDVTAIGAVTSSILSGESVTSISLELPTKEQIIAGCSVTVFNYEDNTKQRFTLSATALQGATILYVSTQTASMNINNKCYVIMTNYDVIKNISVMTT